MGPGRRPWDEEAPIPHGATSRRLSPARPDGLLAQPDATNAPVANYVADVRRAGLGTPRLSRASAARLVGIVMIRKGADGATLSRLGVRGHRDDEHDQGALGRRRDRKTARSPTVGRGLSCLMLGDNDGWGAAAAHGGPPQPLPRLRQRRQRQQGTTRSTRANLVDGLYRRQRLLELGRVRDPPLPERAAHACVALNVIDGSPSVRGGIVDQRRRAATRRAATSSSGTLSHSPRPRTSRDGGAARSGEATSSGRNCVWAGKEANIRGKRHQPRAATSSRTRASGGERRTTTAWPRRAVASRCSAVTRQRCSAGSPKPSGYPSLSCAGAERSSDLRHVRTVGRASTTARLQRDGGRGAPDGSARASARRTRTTVSRTSSSRRGKPAALDVSR